MKFLFTFLFFALLSTNCARKRSVEKVRNLDNNRWAKNSLTDKIWMGKVTVTKTSQDGLFAFVGSQSSMNTGEFEFTKGKLYFYDAKDDKNQQTTRTLINSWDISHSQYRLKKVSGQVTNIEEENLDMAWQEKSHFTVDWETAVINEVDSFPFTFARDCWPKKNSSLVEGSSEVSPDHVSFTVAVDYSVDVQCLMNNYQYVTSDVSRRLSTDETTYSVHYKYSFAPVKDSNYKAYLYTSENDPLMSKYGYFNVFRQSEQKNGSFKNNFFMTRWSKGKHTFYFAKGFPEKYKSIYNDPKEGIIARTNSLFKSNKINLEFEIKDADENHKFGDIRYSFIKVVEERDSASPFGYGPSDANPYTGEIISANTVLWTGSLEYFMDRLQENISNRDKLPSSILKGMEKYLGNSQTNWTSTADNIRNGSANRLVFDFLLPDFTYHPRGNIFSNSYESDNNIYQPMLNEAERLSTPNSYTQLKSHIKKMDDMNDLIEKQNRQMLTQPNHHHTVYAQDSVLTDAKKLLLQGVSRDKIINTILYSVALHEFGHNLNLRHNFYGSVDEVHFDSPISQTDENGNVIMEENNGDSSSPKLFKQYTSSVMDYMGLEQEMYAQRDWKSYDKAALVFAYSDGKIDKAKFENEFLFCTDQHVATNALCNRFDYGTTPSEIAMSIVRNYDERYWSRNFRNNRAWWSDKGYWYAAYRTMNSLKKFIPFTAATYSRSQVINQMSGSPGINPGLLGSIADNIKADQVTAVEIAAAFFASVVAQSDTERPFAPKYNSWNGALEQIGIFDDKILAARSLLGVDYFQYNPNIGTSDGSFISFSSIESIDNAINDTLINDTPSYTGFGSIRSLFYVLNAARYIENSTDQSESAQGSLMLERLRVACFTPNTFNSTFDYSGTPSSFDTISLDGKNVTSAYYSNTNELNILNTGDHYYITADDRNPRAFEIMKKLSVNQAVENYNRYHLLTKGRIPECR